MASTGAPHFRSPWLDEAMLVREEREGVARPEFECPEARGRPYCRHPLSSCLVKPIDLAESKNQFLPRLGFARVDCESLSLLTHAASHLTSSSVPGLPHIVAANRCGSKTRDHEFMGWGMKSPGHATHNGAFSSSSAMLVGRRAAGAPSFRRSFAPSFLSLADSPGA